MLGPLMKPDMVWSGKARSLVPNPGTGADERREKADRHL
jgi:hypothetical protein